MSTRTGAIALGVVLGIVGGVGVYTFVYAHGASYLSKDPAACANCHVMHEQFDGWVKSSHHAVATCNDCHMPASFLPGLVVKANNGFWHSVAFTTGDFPDPIQIKPYNWKIAENACRRCHEPIVHQMDTVRDRDDRLSCISCHGSVGHPKLTTPARAPTR